MNPADLDAQDASDMLRLARGHDAALNDLMSRHADKLFHYLVRQLQSESDASDLAQETFVRLYKHRANYDPEQKFSTWLYTIATNLVRDRFKWRSRHPEVSLQTPVDDSDAELGNVLPDAKASPDAELLQSERSRAVQQAVASLPEDLRTPLVLSEFENVPTAEIATIMKTTPKAVESRLYRARGRLRETLSRWLEKV
jgi:RNA polymerase sigma-70 factor (ECF subfamily)